LNHARVSRDPPGQGQPRALKHAVRSVTQRPVHFNDLSRGHLSRMPVYSVEPPVISRFNSRRPQIRKLLGINESLGKVAVTSSGKNLSDYTFSQH
jgi:hypothetical protein